MFAPISLRQKQEWYRACLRAIPGYLASHPVRKLQLGTGPNALDGWFNTDIFPSSRDILFLDSTKRFPFDDATFDYIFSEHHLEHLTYSEGLLALRECLRVLKPGGKIRIATPSLETLISLYTSTPDALQQRYIRFITDTHLPEVNSYSPAFVINNAFYNWGHQFLYDRATLQSALEKVGFVAVTSAAPGESGDPHLHGLEKHGRFIGHEDMNSFETMVMEGQHPS